MNYILETDRLTKKYGRITAVNEVDLKVAKGSVFGLLGPNGSGKTTTLGMILDVIKPTSGHFKWFGQAPSPAARLRIGSILEKPNFYPGYTGIQNLQLVSKIKGVRPSRIDETIQIVGLSGRGGDKFKTYSLGMKQRLAIASALLNEPEVMILDEPTNGLDPTGIAEIRLLIRDIADSGKTIILASHLLDEVQKVCDQFAVLRQGDLIHTGYVNEDFTDQLSIEISGPDPDHVLQYLSGHTAYIDHNREQQLLIFQMKPETNAASINKELVSQNIDINHFVIRRRRLEDQFLEILADHE